jgi:GT2 family glycosyltransferase
MVEKEQPSYSLTRFSTEMSRLVVSYSIIIVNYNAGSKLVECVESVFRSTSDFELILVDNGSTDGSLSPVEIGFPEAIIVRNAKNIGFARANNLAIRKAMGRWIVLLNPDTRVTKNWLQNLVKCADSSDDIGMVQPKLLRMDGKTLDSAGHVFNFRTCFARDRGSGEIDRGQYEAAEEVEGCSFACAAIKREVIMKVGVLDDKMLLFYDDTDFSIRARIAGWKLYYCPGSVVFHLRAGLTPLQNRGLLHRRAIPYRLRMILKSYSLPNAIKYGAFSMIVSIGAGLKNRDPEYLMRYARSPLWNLLNLPIAERRLVQSTRRIPDTVLAHFHHERSHTLDSAPDGAN